MSEQKETKKVVPDDAEKSEELIQGNWYINAQEKPCDERSTACVYREKIAETMKGKQGFEQCPHLDYCKNRHKKLT